MNKSNWLRSASWDSLWIMSGLWLFPLGVAFFYSSHSESFLSVLLIASLFIGGFHSFLPMLATFTSPSYAERINLDRSRIFKTVTWIFIVSLALAIAGGVFARPEFWLVIGYGYLLWNTWHFSAQNFGVLSLYRSVKEQSSVLERKVDRYYCLTMGCVIQPIVWFCVEVRWGPFVRVFPSWIPTKEISIVTIAVACILTFAYILFELRKQNRSYQKIAYVLSIAVQPFAAVMGYYPFHLLVYSIPHWMVEVGITGTIQAGDAKTTNKNSRKWWPALYLAGLIAVSVGLIYLLEPSDGSDGLIFDWWDQMAKGEVPVQELYLQFTLPALISFLIIPRSFFHFYISRQVFKSTRWTLSKLKLNN